jgi:hypothetical protein
VKQIVPRLRNWCEQHRLTLVDIDLRWGVPAESTSETILRACLSEIDRAKESNENVFFLNMLGHRYGWIPSLTDVPSSISTQYNWIHGVSITHMEILCGAYRDLNPNALFMIRNDDYLPDIPIDFRQQFLESTFSSGVSLQILKQCIRNRFSHTTQVRDYKVQVKEVDTSVTGIPKVIFDGLDIFGEMVYDFMIKAIEKQYPLTIDLNGSLGDDIIVPHEFFLETECEIVLGREQVVDAVLVRNTTRSTPIVISSSKRGIGKSSVVASLAREASSRGHKTVFYSTQAKSEVATFTRSDCASLQLLLCLQLGNQDIIERANKFTKEDLDEEEGQNNISICLSDMFSTDQFDKETATSERPAFIILDEFDDLSVLEAFLPKQLPPGVSVIISSTINDETALENYTEIKLSSLDMTVRSQIIESRLGRFNKQLSPVQMETLMQHPGIGELKWLILACEELRMFGAFETVTDYIKQMPDTVKGLLRRSLSRNMSAATSYGDGVTCLLMKDALLLCLVEEGGLRERELMDVLTVRLQTLDIKGRTMTHIAYAEWSVVHLFIKALVRLMPHNDGSNLLVLASVDAKQVVETFFDVVNNIVLMKTYITLLADYFEPSVDDERRQQTYPQLLLRLGDLPRLFAFKDREEFELVPYSIRSGVVRALRCVDRFSTVGHIKPQLERMCIPCTMKISRGRSRLQSCFLCGCRVFTTQSAVDRESLRLWGQESLVYRCRSHNMDAWITGFVQRCCGCRTSLVKEVSFSRAVIKCTSCSIGDVPFSFRCCQLVRE